MFRYALILVALPALAADLPGMAAGILEQTGQARQAVANRDRDSAVTHLDQADELVRQIEKEVPPKTRPILVPVYRETDATSSYAPVKRGRSGQAPERRFEKNTSVRSVEGETTIGRLDVTTAADRLQAARAALDRADWTAADTALAAIPNAVLRTVVVGNMPLMSARENLTLARNRVLDGQYKDAAAPLRAAAQALADFEKIAPGPRAQDAEYARQKIETCASNIEKDHSDTAGQIEDWLEQVTAWEQEMTK